MTVRTTHAPAPPRPPVRRLGVAGGTALCAGAVLGPGVLALPALAADAAGPASVLAWVVLLVTSVPVAVSFAALGARFPDGGGVATFVHRAAGPRAAAVVGWWFYGAVPLGVVSAALIGGQYVAGAMGWGDAGATAVGALVVAASAAANCGGLHLSGRVQLLLVGLLVAVLLGATLAAAPGMRAAHFTPFMPHGWGSVGSAAAVLFFAFAGWEAASHLSGEFADPARDLPRVTACTLAVVSVLYLGLAVTTIGALGPAAAGTDTPLTELLARSMGTVARPVAAAVALFLTFGTVNTYLAGASRLGAALGRDGAAPRRLAAGGGPGQVPRYSLAVLAVACAAVGTAVTLGAADLDRLMRATSACLASVTLAGLLSALALLPRRTLLWWAAGASALLTTVVLAFAGVLLLIPAGLAVAAWGFVAYAGRRRAG
ncbi:amino acid permease [Streptomyces sp. HU2014]|uniref:Amino acid permease n=1 Tax=Streptomyces albireticuli TaxID=1940 RepID=A0A1Z2L9B0_9ACTN|nr:MULTISPECIES: amino acid permease [Streptomyces]ARZ70876.1 amino acid permease [Streptomyces albireticuli]UQI44341.1 amino acid permease [Streptomyces sp. HU2014]